MARLYFTLLGLLFALHSLGIAQNNKGRSLWLKVDTPIVLRLTGTLRSDSSKSQTASLVTTDDITVDDLVVNPKGTAVLHHVTVGDARRFNRPGELQLIVEGVYALDGQMVPLSCKQHRVAAHRASSAIACSCPYYSGRRENIPPFRREWGEYGCFSLLPGLHVIN